MNPIVNLILPPNADPRDPLVRSRAGQRCGALGIFANVLLFAGKLLAGTLSGSLAITADAMNNLSDATSAIVTLLGFRMSEKPADEHHPYGHARFEYLSGLAVAVMILIIGFELAKSSAEKILNPTEVHFTLLTGIILLGSITVKLLLSSVNAAVSKATNSSALAATAADSRNDCIATGGVFLSGLFAQLSGVTVDGFVGLAVAAFILWSGWNMVKETINPLLGENADPELQRVIVDCLRSNEKVLGYHDLMVHDYGPGQRFASVHVEMDYLEDPLLCHTIIDNIERLCLDNHRIHLVIHYDPVVTDDEEMNGLKQLVAQALKEIDEGLGFHDFRIVRGDTHTNLIFDVALPNGMKGREKEIKHTLDEAINENSETKYYTVITFDSAAFNTQELWR